MLLFAYQNSNLKKLFVTLFVPRVKEGPISVPSFYFMYSIWQDAGIRTRVVATAARCAYTGNANVE